MIHILSLNIEFEQQLKIKIISLHIIYLHEYSQVT